MEILRGLAARGHEVVWYSGRARSDMPTRLGSVQLIYGFRGLLVYMSGHFWLRKNHSKFDIVIDQINTFGFLAPWVTSRVVVLFHQLADDVWDAEVRWPFNLIGRFAETLMLNRYRRTPFITMSHTTVMEMAHYGWQGSGYVAATGIDRISVYEKTVYPSVCFLGRYQARAKRLDHAVKIFLEAKKHLPDLRFRAIGRGTPPMEFFDLEDVEFYSDVDDNWRDELLGSSWCCIVTSVREGWGRMVSEAGAMGTASLAYDVPGLRDSVVDGVTGLLVTPDITVAANALVALLKDSDLLKKMGDSAQEMAQSMTWESTVDEFERVLLTICADADRL